MDSEDKAKLEQPAIPAPKMPKDIAHISDRKLREMAVIGIQQLKRENQELRAMTAQVLRLMFSLVAEVEAVAEEEKAAESPLLLPPTIGVIK